MSSEIKYDYNKADQLKQKVKSMVSGVKGELSKFKVQNIDSTREWWSGQDQAAFVNKYDETARKINNLFEDFDNFYNTLITNVSNSKQEHTSGLAKNM